MKFKPKAVFDLPVSAPCWIEVQGFPFIPGKSLVGVGPAGGSPADKVGGWEEEKDELFWVREAGCEEHRMCRAQPAAEVGLWWGKLCFEVCVRQTELVLTAGCSTWLGMFSERPQRMFWGQAASQQSGFSPSTPSEKDFNPFLCSKGSGGGSALISPPLSTWLLFGETMEAIQSP